VAAISYLFVVGEIKRVELRGVATPPAEAPLAAETSR